MVPREVETPDQSSARRKARKEMMHSRRVGKEDAVAGDNTTLAEERPKKRARTLSDQQDSENKSKYNLRYEPDVPMSKEAAAEWRREARKARNRASAAASRQKIRGRIDELEAECENLRAMYAAAVERIAELESSSDDPPPLGGAPTTNFQQGIVSPPATPPVSPETSHHEVMHFALLDDSTTTDDNLHQGAVAPQDNTNQHLIQSISRQA